MFDKKFDIKIKKIDDKIEMPFFSKPFDSGIDLRSTHMATIKHGVISEIHTGLYVELPDPKDTFPFVLEMQIRPRSGLARKEGIIVVNTPGTIDNQYRGEIIVLLTRLKYMSDKEKQENKSIFKQDELLITTGERIAQAVIVPVLSTNMLNIVKVDEINKTFRGEDGMGSTGIN